MVEFLIIGLAFLGSIECRAELNPSGRDPDVVAALAKAGEELKIGVVELYAGQISRCEDEKITVWVWRRDGEQDMLLPWVVEYRSGVWTVRRHQDG